ncbi:MAG: hypothetical protein CMP91_03080 [Gammaproteobacteria bacterium]|nr:hypothetical protein [Gammaproteobacteria bacterium]|tara:strand:+ start:74056 stop:74439 length:384 start_codon:yes stop_codon:yes gene_type:complete
MSHLIYKEGKKMKKIGLFLLACSSVFAVNMVQAENVTPVVDVSPEYPESALRREAAGYVVVRFDVRDGKAHNISIVEAEPARLFDSAVHTALIRSTFEVEGDATEAANIERVYRFTPPQENTQIVAN